MKISPKKSAHSHKHPTEAAVADVTAKEDTMTAQATDPTAPAASATIASTAPAASATVASTGVSLPPLPAAIASMTIPTVDQITQAVALLDSVRTILAPVAVALTTDQRRRALRAKKGGEATTGLMISLGTRYDLRLPGVDPQQIQQFALLAQRLQPLETRLRVMSGLVTDTLGNARAESWQGTTALYTALSRASNRNAGLQKELEPAVAFFKKARKATARGKTGGATAAPAVQPATGGEGTSSVAAATAPASPVTSAAPAAQAPSVTPVATK